MTLADFDLESYSERNAALVIEAKSCRKLWASVVLWEMNLVSRAVQKLKEENLAAKAEAEIKTLRSWLCSRDGRHVLALAGVDYSERAVAKILSAVWDGRAITYIERGRLN